MPIYLDVDSMAPVTVRGGTGNNSFTGNFSGDFNMSLGLSGFAAAALQTQGNFTGSFLSPNLGTAAAPIQQIQIGGSMTAPAKIKVNFLNTLSVGGDLAGTVMGYGDSGNQALPTIGTITIGGNITATGTVTAPILGTAILTDLAGHVTETHPAADMQSLTLRGSLTTTGQVNAASIGALSVGQDLAGTVAVSGPLGTAKVAGSLTGSLSAGSIGSLSVGKDLTGHVTAAQQLGPIIVGGTSSGSISAGQVFTLAAANAHGPLILDVVQGAVERKVLATALPGFSLSAVSFTYSYDATSGPYPRLTLHVVNTDPVHDRFDLSLLTSSALDNFDLARLDAKGSAGLNDITIEGDLLPSGIQLPADHLGSISIWGNATAKAIAAASVQGVAFAALVTSGRTVSSLQAGAVDASGLLAAGTGLRRRSGHSKSRLPMPDRSPCSSRCKGNQSAWTREGSCSPTSRPTGRQ